MGRSIRRHRQAKGSRKVKVGLPKIAKRRVKEVVVGEVSGKWDTSHTPKKNYASLGCADDPNQLKEKSDKSFGSFLEHTTKVSKKFGVEYISKGRGENRW